MENDIMETTLRNPKVRKENQFFSNLKIQPFFFCHPAFLPHDTGMLLASGPNIAFERLRHAEEAWLHIRIDGNLTAVFAFFRR